MKQSIAVLGGVVGVVFGLGAFLALAEVKQSIAVLGGVVEVIFGFGAFLAWAETTLLGGDFTSLVLPRLGLVLILLNAVVIAWEIWDEYKRRRLRQMRKFAKDLKARQAYR